MWADMYGAVEAYKVCRKVRPQPLSGRWGKCAELEQYFLEADPVHTKDVFERLLNKAQSTPQRRAAPRSSVDEPAMEECAEYTDKMGRWARSALAALRNPLFCTAVKISYKLGSELEHLNNALKQKVSDSGPRELARL